MANYSKNPAWNMAYDQGLLVLAAGSDKLFAVEDITEPVAQEMLAQWQSDHFDPDQLTPPARDIFTQLLTAEIIINELADRPYHKLSLKFIGDPHPQLLAQLKDQLPATVKLTHDEPDLLLIVRTNARLRDVVADPYPKTSIPHLFVDTALEHTASIGPLVFMGDTACLGCYVGRVTTYWGDAEPPTKPAILQNPALLAGLIALEVSQILLNRNRSLINTTVAYDFEEHKLHKNKVYKLPPCPVCSISTIDVAGAIDLPWLKRAK